MKTRIRSLLAVAFIACGLITITGCGGCKSASRTSYVTSGVTHVTVRAGLSGWNDYLMARDAALAPAAPERRKLGEQNAKVQDAFGKYRAAQLALVTAAQKFSKVPPGDPEHPAEADRLNASVAASAATLGSLIALLNEFGISTK